MAIRLIKENKIYKEISDEQYIETNLSDVYMTIVTLRRLMYEVALSYDQAENIEISASMLKLCAAEWGWKCIDKIMQLVGDKAERSDNPISHWYHLLRHARIGGGTSEMMRIKIAQFLLHSKWDDNN
jgi:alkylation response protein AidB-like acyl-CoA dehydrogenase